MRQSKNFNLNEFIQAKTVLFEVADFDSQSPCLKKLINIKRSSFWPMKLLKATNIANNWTLLYYTYSPCSSGSCGTTRASTREKMEAQMRMIRVRSWQASQHSCRKDLGFFGGMTLPPNCRSRFAMSSLSEVHRP